MTGRIKTLHLTTDLRDLACLATWLEQLATDWHVPSSRLFGLNLALEEAVVNVMEYAFPGQEGQPVTLVAERHHDGIRFVLDDQGIPFDPTLAAVPDVTLPADQRPIGGLGILLLRNYMSDVSYCRSDGHNRLTMYLSLQNLRQ